MRDNIMFIPAVILMIVEALAVGFLIWSWCDAKREARNRRDRHSPAPELMPMGAITYAVACSICKNPNSDKCDACLCEVESGFELDAEKVRRLEDGKG